MWCTRPRARHERRIDDRARTNNNVAAGDRSTHTHRRRALHVFTHMCKVATESQAHCTELGSLGHEEFPHSRMQTAQSGKAPAAQQRKSKHKIHSESTQQRAHKCDPITSVVTTMLTEPLHFVLSETGASFFKQHTACTFPNNLISKILPPKNLIK